MELCWVGVGGLNLELQIQSGLHIGNAHSLCFNHSVSTEILMWKFSSSDSRTTGTVLERS